MLWSLYKTLGFADTEAGRSILLGTLENFIIPALFLRIREMSMSTLLNGGSVLFVENGGEALGVVEDFGLLEDSSATS